ncbi:MAG TPA: hypothetical protein VKI61_12090 [Chitinophagaceae bacterium]|jgi:hypothetical protein|nr:hypothetical protein [Chitinophagaceae bacterium]
MNYHKYIFSLFLLLSVSISKAQKVKDLVGGQWGLSEDKNDRLIEFYDSSKFKIVYLNGKDINEHGRFLLDQKNGQTVLTLNFDSGNFKQEVILLRLRDSAYLNFYYLQIPAKNEKDQFIFEWQNNYQNQRAYGLGKIEPKIE